jgi:hypothetical protein
MLLAIVSLIIQLIEFYRLKTHDSQVHCIPNTYTNISIRSRNIYEKGRSL